MLRLEHTSVPTVEEFYEFGGRCVFASRPLCLGCCSREVVFELEYAVLF